MRLLGGLVVEGFDERELGSRKGRTVLKALALGRGRPVPVDRLAEIVWAGEQPARPAEQLGVLVSRLRGVLGQDRLPRTDAGYALRADWLDLDELTARTEQAAGALKEGRLAAARTAAQAAIALARGDLLPEEEGEWVEAERTLAAALVAAAHRTAAEAALRSGGPRSPLWLRSTEWTSGVRKRAGRPPRWLVQRPTGTPPAHSSSGSSAEPDGYSGARAVNKMIERTNGGGSDPRWTRASAVSAARAPGERRARKVAYWAMPMRQATSCSGLRSGNGTFRCSTWAPASPAAAAASEARSTVARRVAVTFRTRSNHGSGSHPPAVTAASTTSLTGWQSSLA